MNFRRLFRPFLLFLHWAFLFKTLFLVATKGIRYPGNIFRVGIYAIYYLVLWVVRRRRRTRNIASKRRGTYTADQHLAIVRLEQMVSAVEAQQSHPWKSYLPPLDWWKRANAPPMPTIDEVEAVLRECEVAIGPFHENIQDGLQKLINMSSILEDWLLHRKMLERFLIVCECLHGRRSEALISVLTNLGRVHVLQKRYKEGAEAYSRVASMLKQRLLKGKRENEKEHKQRLMVERLLVVAYIADRQWDAAEVLLKDLVPEMETKFGVLHAGIFGTKEMTMMLFEAYLDQVRKARFELEDSADAEERALRYLRDATALIGKLDSSRASALKKLGRLFVLMGKVSDGELAFRLGNSTVDQTGDVISCSTCGGAHGALRICNVCSKDIKFHDKWHFCKSCADVDLCSDCYSGGSAEWEDVEKFPRECLVHDFFEVGIDGKESEWTVERWVTDVCERITAEIIDQIEERKRELAKRTLNPQHSNDQAPISTLLQTPSPVKALPGYFLDTIQSVHILDVDSPYEFAKTWWQFDRISRAASASPIKKLHHIAPTYPLLCQKAGYHTEYWAFNGSTDNPSTPFYLHPFISLQYSAIMLDIFTTILSEMNYIATNPEIRQNGDGSKSYTAPRRFSSPTRQEGPHKPNAQVTASAQQIQSRLVSLYKRLSSKNEFDMLGASLFDYDNIRHQIANLSVPVKQLSNPKPKPNSYHVSLSTYVIDQLTPGANLGIGPEHSGAQERNGELVGLQRPYYNVLQSWLTECSDFGELKMRVTIVIHAARKIKALGCRINTPPQIEDIGRFLDILRKALSYWEALTNIPSSTEDNETDLVSSEYNNREMAQFLAERIVDMARQLHAIVHQDGDEGIVNFCLGASTSTSFEEKRRNLQEILKILTKHVEHTIHHAPGVSSHILSTPLVAKTENKHNKAHTFFLTKHGFSGLTVLGDKMIQESNSILLLEGVRWPVVAERKDGDKYEFVGYVRLREFIEENWWESEDMCRLKRKEIVFV